MFDCKNCKTLEDEVKFLRAQLSSMTDRLVAIASPGALQAVNQSQFVADDFYGTSSQDEVISYNNYGEKVLVKRENA